MPKFSVIINCLNGERFLKHAIDSVFQQTFTDWEIVFFDSCSIDRSVEIATSYGERVRVFRADRPITLGEARQAAVDHASGDFLAFLDVDDVWRPAKLEIQYAAIESGEFDICYGGVQCIDEHGNNLHKIIPIHATGPLFERLLTHVEGAWCTYVVNRKKLLEKGTRFNPLLRASCEEDMILSFLAYDGKGVVLDAILAEYRIVGGSVTSRYSNRLSFERFMTLSRLAKENPDLVSKYYSAYRQAEARGHYYQARFMFEEGDFSGAYKAIKLASKIDNKYHVMLLLIKFPIFWRLAHRFKGLLTPLWLRYVGSDTTIK